MTGMTPDGKKRTVGLKNAVDMWTTPQAHDTSTGKAERLNRHGTKHGCRNLNDQVLMWPTIRATDGEKGGPNQQYGSGKPGLSRAMVNWGTPRITTNNGYPSPQCTGRGSRLEDQIVMKNWPTPANRDYKGRDLSSRNGGAGLSHAVETGELTHAGQPAREKFSINGKNPGQWPSPHGNCMTGAGRQGRQGGDNLQTKTNGLLNAEWVEQLQGLPPDWTKLSYADPEDNRVDRLRLLGNGVVPQTAAKAIITLMSRMEAI